MQRLIMFLKEKKKNHLSQTETKVTWQRSFVRIQKHLLHQKIFYKTLFNLIQ